MDSLLDLINSIQPTYRAKYGRKTLSSVLAQAEQAIFDNLLLNREIGDVASAKRLLAQLHAGDNPGDLNNFDAYVGKLNGLRSSDPFVIDLRALMTEVNNSENPQAVLESLVSQERKSGLVTEQNIIPEGFWGRRAPTDPGMAGATARFQTEFADEPSLLSGALDKTQELFAPSDYTAENWFSGAKQIGIPAENLGNWDFSQISEYFSSNTGYSDLTALQQQLIESMRYTDEQFTSVLGDQGPRIHELREQLRNELAGDNVLSQAEIREFVGIRESFGVSAEQFSMHFASSLGEHVMPTSFSNIKEFVTGGEEGVGLLGGVKGAAETLAGTFVGRDKVNMAKSFLADAQEHGIVKTLRGRAVGAAQTKLESIFGNMEPEAAREVFAGVFEFGGQEAVNSLVGIDSFGKVYFNTGSYGLAQWAEHQASSIAMAPIITPIIMGIAALASPEHTKEMTNYINIGLAAWDFIATWKMIGTFGDPTGLIVTAIQQIYEETQRLAARVKDNEKPESFRGDRIGYVRSGNTWFPAIMSKKMESTSWASGDSSFTLEYGENLLFMPMGNGTSEAFFQHPTYLDVKVPDWMLTDTTAQGEHFYGKTHLNNYDIMRNWYLLPPGSNILDAELEMHDVDYASMTSWGRDMQDWRKGLELAQIWHNKYVLNEIPEAHVGEAPSDRALRNLSLVNWYGQQQTLAQIEMDYQNMGWDHNFIKDENQYLKNEIFMDTFKNLISAQRLAAKEQNYDKDYSKDYEDEGLGKQTIWSSLYLDNEKSSPTAQTADELETQLNTISNLEDRSMFQKDYLAQKSMTRFWLREISDRGGMNEFLDFTQENRYSVGNIMDTTPEPFLSETYTKGVPDSRHVEQRWPALSSMRFSGGMGGIPIIPSFDELPDQTDLSTEGWVMPWSNEGEGVVPDAYFSTLDSEHQEYFLTTSANTTENLKTLFGEELPISIPIVKTRENITSSLNAIIEAEAKQHKNVVLAEQKKIMEHMKAGAMLRDAEQRAVERRRRESEQGLTNLLRIPDNVEILIRGKWVHVTEIATFSQKGEGNSARLYKPDGTFIREPKDYSYKYRDYVPEPEPETWDFRPLTSTNEDTQKLFDDLAASNPEIFAWISNNQHKDFPGYTADNDSKAFKYMLDYIESKLVVPLPEAGGTITPTEEDILKHIEENVDIHRDTNGNPIGLVYEGEIFHLDETPDVETLDWDDLNPFEKLEHHLQLEGHSVIKEELTPENYPEYTWRDNVPVYGHDVALEEKLHLPENVLAVMGSNGVVIKAYNPFHTIPTEGIYHD